MNVLVFLVLRALHVLLAAVWIGSNVFLSAMLMPVIDQAGASGGQVMLRMNRRGITPFMAALGTATMATGLYLFWHFTGGFDAGVSTSPGGLAFGTGGAAGILAGIIGAAVVGRSANKVSQIMGQTSAATEGAVKDALVQQVRALQRRMKTGSRVVIMLQTIALVLMAVGHYV
jgi:hypothetical protein